MISWDDPDDRYFSTGVDRGVLYSEDGAVPWNGIIGVTEAGGGNTSLLYRDGHIYYSDVEPGDYSGSLTAFFWPAEFDKCLGMPEIAPGFHVDYQKPRHFGLSYRSLIGSGTRGDMFGYQIHVVYTAIASAQSRTRKTRTNSPELDEFSFDLVATPVRVPGYRPTAHFIIDTRGLSEGQITTLEDLLYNHPTLPDPVYIYELLKFGDAIHFVDLLDGRIRVTGSTTNVNLQPDGRVEINNVDGSDSGLGYYNLSDTP